MIREIISIVNRCFHRIFVIDVQEIVRCSTIKRDYMHSVEKC